MSTTGFVSDVPPREPNACASPKLNTSPAAVTSQYPLPSGLAQTATTGLVNLDPPIEPYAHGVRASWCGSVDADRLGSLCAGGSDHGELAHPRLSR